MNNNCLSREQRDCPHCHTKDSIAYYHEADNFTDLYYCQKCYGIIGWDGIKVKMLPGEAYPERDKTKAITLEDDVRDIVKDVCCKSEGKLSKDEFNALLILATEAIMERVRERVSKRKIADSITIKKGGCICTYCHHVRKEAGQVIAKPASAVTLRVINDRFTDNGDGTITDKQLKVIWVKDPSVIDALKSTMNFDAARSACEKLQYAGFNSGWRMPTVEELRSIVDYTRSEPAWDINVFGGKHDDWYWTSTPCAWDRTGSAWVVTSSYGPVNGSLRSFRNYVRPVRSSQCQFDR
jgi:hypothetical protein